MTGVEDPPERVLTLMVPTCDPEQVAPERRMHTAALWQRVVHEVQRMVPGAVSLRPGCCVMRARGPARYYGSEVAAAVAVLDGVTALFATTREDESHRATVGVGSGRFAAEQAASCDPATPLVQHPAPGVRLVPAAQTAAFLSGLPLGCVADDTLAPVLLGLGIGTLGAFAALPEQAVLARFGAAARVAHRRARGLGEIHGAEVAAAPSAPDLTVSFDCEPPLAGVDQLAFACSSYAEQFVRGLHGHGVVCTELRVELVDDTAASHTRDWSHPANFTAADVVNRVRWQAATLPQLGERGGAGVAAVRLTPVRTALAATHEPGLWNSAPDEKVHHQLTRVQSLLGPEGVGTGAVLGGRSSAARQHLTPWGSDRGPTPRAEPWPGHLTGPLPTLLCPHTSPVLLLGAQQEPVLIDSDELLSSTPAFFSTSTASPLPVRSWSAPWPLREQWWEQSPTVHPTDAAVYRLQLELATGDAWLLRYTAATGWHAEGKYS